jgi:hypothetical protein
MSSEVCKEILVEEYEDTTEKEWKRVSKYKNTLGMEVRQFNHPEVGDVWMLSEDGEEFDIFESKDSALLFKKGEITPASYLFTIKEGMTYKGNTDIMLTSVAFFKEEGYADDRHDMIPGNFFPKAWNATEELEGVWSVKQPVDTVIHALVKLGFQRSDAFDRLCEGISVASTPEAKPARKHEPDTGFEM